MRAAILSLTGVTFGLVAAAGTTAAQPTGSQAELPRGPQLSPAPFSSLAWRAIGPTIFSGRIQAIAVDRHFGEPDKVYVTGATGGVFRSTNGGTSWTPIFDDVNAMMSMGDLAISPSRSDIVWIGTGEGNNPSHDWGQGN